MDFRQPTALGARIADGHEQLAFGRGYDHNFVLDRTTAACLVDPGSGRALAIRTSELGLQLYSGNRFDGRTYQPYAGVALESQRFPDSPNRPHFPSAVLRPAEVYESITELTFFIAPPSGSSSAACADL